VDESQCTTQALVSLGGFSWSLETRSIRSKDTLNRAERNKENSMQVTMQ
jgi:hypothetical protein